MIARAMTDKTCRAQSVQTYVTAESSTGSESSVVLMKGQRSACGKIEFGMILRASLCIVGYVVVNDPYNCSAHSVKFSSSKLPLGIQNAV